MGVPNWGRMGVEGMCRMRGCGMESMKDSFDRNQQHEGKYGGTEVIPPTNQLLMICLVVRLPLTC